MRYAVAAILITVGLTPALAGGRCFVQRQVCVPVVKQQVIRKVQQVAVPQQVINISNVYPQGSTQYTAASAAQLYSTNPSLAIESSARVAQDAVQSLTAAIQVAGLTNADVAAVAKIQAATQHLQSATGIGSGPNELTLRITQGAGGIQVEPIGQDTTGGEAPAPPPAGAGAFRSCTKCHGQQQAAPAGGLFLHDGVSLGADQAMRVVEILKGVNVPEQMRDTVAALSDAERNEVLEAALTAWRRK